VLAYDRNGLLFKGSWYCLHFCWNCPPYKGQLRFVSFILQKQKAWKKNVFKYLINMEYVTKLRNNNNNLSRHKMSWNMGFLPLKFL